MEFKPNGVADLLEGAAPSPNSSDDYIVTKYVYNPIVSSTGAIIDVIDNAGRTSETQYDLAGRVIRTIENDVGGPVAAGDTDCNVCFRQTDFSRLPEGHAKSDKKDKPKEDRRVPHSVKTRI